MVIPAPAGKGNLIERNYTRKERLRRLHQARSQGMFFVESSNVPPGD